MGWASSSPHLAPRGASNSPKRLPRRPHDEANGPTQPPRLIWRRIWTCFLLILDPKSKKKKKRPSYKPFEATLGSRVIYYHYYYYSSSSSVFLLLLKALSDTSD